MRAECTAEGVLDEFNARLNEDAVVPALGPPQHFPDNTQALRDRLAAWRRIWHLGYNSLRGQVKTYVDNRNPNDMDAGELVHCVMRQFRDIPRTQQKVWLNEVNAARWKYGSENDIRTFLDEMRTKMRKCPNLVVPNNNVAADEAYNEHIKDKLSIWLPSGFNDTIAFIKLQDNPTLEQITTWLESKVSDLLEKNEFKGQNDSFFGTYQESPNDHNNGSPNHADPSSSSNARETGSWIGNQPEIDVPGLGKGVFMSAAAFKRACKNQRKAGRDACLEEQASTYWTSNKGKGKGKNHGGKANHHNNYPSNNNHQSSSNNKGGSYGKAGSKKGKGKGWWERPAPYQQSGQGKPTGNGKGGSTKGHGGKQGGKGKGKGGYDWWGY